MTKERDDKGREMTYWGGKKNKQQTAVSQLIEQLRKLAHNPKTHLGMGDIRVTQGYLDELEEQAKQMEKKQHRHTWLYEGDIDNASYERFERYYQVTFGGQGSPDTTSPNTQNK